MTKRGTKLGSFRSRTAGRLFVHWLGAATVLVGAGCLRGTGPALTEEATPPMFSLPSTRGLLDSPDAVGRGPLVLIFYRGHW